MMRIEWQEADLKTVVQWYVDAFRFKRGESLFRHDWFVDPAKGKVIFRLFISDELTTEEKPK